MEALLLVLGAMVGALATGGVSAWDAWRQRRARRRVAARVILGGLYVLEAILEVILDGHRWPDRLDLQVQLQEWREVRAAFAEGVEAWEWALVDGVFSNLHRTALMVRPGQPCTAEDEKVVAWLLAVIPRARGVVLEYAASESERNQLAKQLGGQGSEHEDPGGAHESAG